MAAPGAGSERIAAGGWKQLRSLSRVEDAPAAAAVVTRRRLSPFTTKNPFSPLGATDDETTTATTTTTTTTTTGNCVDDNDNNNDNSSDSSNTRDMWPVASPPLSKEVPKSSGSGALYASPPLSKVEPKSSGSAPYNTASPPLSKERPKSSGSGAPQWLDECSPTAQTSGVLPVIPWVLPVVVANPALPRNSELLPVLPGNSGLCGRWRAGRATRSSKQASKASNHHDDHDYYDDMTCHTCVDNDNDDGFSIAPICCSGVCGDALGATRTALNSVRFAEPATISDKASCTAEAIEAEKIEDVEEAKYPPPTWFQSNPFVGPHFENHENPALPERLLQYSLCCCSPVGVPRDQNTAVPTAPQALNKG